MAIAAWILTKTDNRPVIDGIVNAVVNADSLGSAATTIAEAVATAVAAGHPLYSNYFNTATLFLTTYATDEDGVFFGERAKTDSIA